MYLDDLIWVLIAIAVTVVVTILIASIGIVYYVSVERN